MMPYLDGHQGYSPYVLVHHENQLRHFVMWVGHNLSSGAHERRGQDWPGIKPGLKFFISVAEAVLKPRILCLSLPSA